jgi:biotin operon repressor
MRLCTSWEQADAIRRSGISIDATQGKEVKDQAPEQSLMRLCTSWEQADSLRRSGISIDATQGQEVKDQVMRLCTSWEQADSLRRSGMSIDATQGQEVKDQAPKQSLMPSSWEQVDALRRGVVSIDTTRGQDVVDQASQKTETSTKDKAVINDRSKVRKDGMVSLQKYNAACGGDSGSVELLWPEDVENVDVKMLSNVPTHPWCHFFISAAAW